MQANIETFIGCDADFDEADLVLFGAPFDSTTSFRPGARFGPSAMRHESFGLETWSPYQNRDLTDYKVFDSGDLELCFGSAEAALHDIVGTEGDGVKLRGQGNIPVHRKQHMIIKSRLMFKLFHNLRRAAKCEINVPAMEIPLQLQRTVLKKLKLNTGVLLVKLREDRSENIAI